MAVNDMVLHGGITLADGTIGTSELAADAVDGTKIADDAVDSEHYTDGSIDTAHIAADAIDGTLIADDAVDSEHYTDGSIDTAHIADANVTAAKCAAAVTYKTIFVDYKSGEITADDADRYICHSPIAGNIVDVGLRVEECGTDDTDPLFLELDAKIGGTSCLTTKPKIDKTSGTDDEVETFSAAPTGGAQAVIDTDNDDIAVGDKIVVTFDITRTTPDTEITGATAIITIAQKVGS